MEERPHSTTLLLDGTKVQEKDEHVTTLLEKADETSLKEEEWLRGVVLSPPRGPCGRKCTRCICLLSVCALFVAAISFSSIMIGVSTASPGDSFISIAGPSAPHTSAANYTSLLLTWSTPQFEPSLIASFSLEQNTTAVDEASRTASFEEVYNGAAPRAAVDGLTPDSTYLYRVRFLTVNEQMSNYSDVGIAHTLTPVAPGAPAAVYLSGTSSSSLSLAWPVPASNGAAITAYLVNMTEAASQQWRVAEAAEAALDVEGLETDAQYRVAVAAQNEVRARGVRPSYRAIVVVMIV
jgi:hypothetical protein